MNYPRIVISSFFVSVLAATAASCQDYPSKPIRIVTSPAGGGNDFVARLIAQGLTSAALAQPIVVDNRTALISVEIVAKAPPDGYTLLVASSSFVVGPLLQKLSYDPVRDFLPIIKVGIAPNILVVHPSLPVRSVMELIALAKSKPGELNYSSAGTGSAPQLAGELFKYMAKVKIVEIPYKGGSTPLNAVLTGEVHMVFATVAPVAPLLKSGRLRALAVTGLEPSTLAPGLPTVAATGLPGFEIVSIYGLLAPAKTPETIINRLDQEIERYLKTPQAIQTLLSIGVEASPSPPREYEAIIKAEMARMDKVIKEAHLRIE